MNYNVVEDEEIIATIFGSQSIEADLEQIYASLEFCPDTFREWVEDITLEPVCEALSMAEALNAEAEDEAPTWEEWLQERFPLPSDRNLTMGAVALQVPEERQNDCPQSLDEDGKSLTLGYCNRIQAHSPDFWLNHPDVNYFETAIEFVEQCTIEWYDPFFR